MLDYNLRGTVKNARIAPHWFKDQNAFWYQRQTDQGVEYVTVNAAGERSPLFDHRRLAEALAPLAVSSAAHLEVIGVETRGPHRTVSVRLSPDLTARCDLETYRCEPKPVPPTRPDEIPSPDGSQAVFARENNPRLRHRGSGQQRQLTRDGEPFFAYGKLPDTSLTTVPVLRRHAPLAPVDVSWTPDGKKLIVGRKDERAIAVYPYVEWVPQDGSFRPVEYQLRLPLPGDAGTPPPLELAIVDVASAGKKIVALPEGWSLLSDVLAWTDDQERCFALAGSFDGRQARLLEINTASGDARTLIEEASPTPVWPNEFTYSPPNVRVLGGGSEVVWFSERDGWGHLYLYDARTASLKRQLTRGSWLVRDVIEVDEARRELFFTASGREPGWDPYYRALYRVSLDGGEPVLLAPEKAEHQIESAVPFTFSALYGTPFQSPVRPGAAVFVDTRSTVSEPPVTTLRSTRDGAVVCTLEAGDAGKPEAAGWRAPESFVVKAADHETDLYGVLYFPPGYERGKTYPVIDAFYGGPQMINTPKTFTDAVAAFNPVSRASLAQLGFIVLTLDGRGTPGRSRAFHDLSYGDFADPEIEDHAAAIKELAARYGTFDLGRVGVYGHSFGGYTSARAILKHPELYRVAVSSAGPHNFQGFYDGLESFLGVPDYGHGARLRPQADAVPSNYKRLDDAELADRLRGHLMLVYGDMDENALPAVTFQFANALIKANKTFDLVYLPNRTHSFFRTDPYYTRRLWDYFVERLLGATPPENYVLKPPPN